MNFNTEGLNDTYYVQSVLFNSKYTSMTDALFWLFKYSFEIIDVKEEPPNFVFKIHRKSLLRFKGFRNFTRKFVDIKRGISFIIATKDPVSSNHISLPSTI